MSVTATQPAAAHTAPRQDAAWLDAHWMPFTANRQFKRDPRMIVAAQGAYFTDGDGRQGDDQVVGHLRARQRPPQLQRRDGAAMVAFLAWLDAQDPAKLDEIAIVKRLETIRVETAGRLGKREKQVAHRRGAEPLVAAQEVAPGVARAHGAAGGDGLGAQVKLRVR